MISGFILWLAKNILQKIWPMMDLQKAQKIVIISLIALVLLVVFIFGWRVVGWFKPTPKIDQVTVQTINDKNEAKRDAAVEKLVTDNQELLTTVDQRSTISDLDIYAKQNEIDKKVEEVKIKVEKAKATSNQDITQEQLVCLLTKPVEECQ